MSLASLFRFSPEPAKQILIWKSETWVLYTVLVFKTYYYFSILIQHSIEIVNIDLIWKSNESKRSSSIPKLVTDEKGSNEKIANNRWSMRGKNAEQRNNELFREKYKTKKTLDLKPLTICI